MEEPLKRTYFRWLTAVALVWTAGRIIQHVMPRWCAAPHVWASSGPILFILTAVCALAGPILYRTLFAHSKRNHTRIAADTFFTFERHLILIGMAALGLAMVADFLAVSFFYRSGSLLIALYAVYCGFPSKKRLALDRRIYRAAGGSRNPPDLVVYHNPRKRQPKIPKVNQQ
ncbi:MAG: hypothetical protein KQI78_19355 [Deltaproteobacteria bacterium]|nr:hypothetical protein [Deltaproteobacteria bacterium]